MKPRDIHRGVASRPERRGTAPDLGSVSRVRKPDVLDEDGFAPRRSSSRNQTQSKLVIAWSVGLGVGAFAIMVGAFLMWLRPQLKRDQSAAVRVAEEEDQSVRVVSEFASPDREEALRLVKEALANRDPGQVEKMFRMGAFTPKEIVDYCAGTEARDGSFEGFEWLSSLDGNGLPIEGVAVNYQKDRALQRFALLTPDSKGRWKVDFDAFARTVKPSWSELLAGGDGGLVRVTAAPDVYYNGAFSDESRWTAYVLSSPDVEEVLHGYCRTGSHASEAMKRIFADGTASSRVTLRINRVKEGESRQFEISDFLARDWIVVERPGKG